jgi:hypothetical protein
MLAITLFRLTVRGVLSDIPHDPSAFVTYALLLAFVAFVYTGSRKRADNGDPPPSRGSKS